MSVNGSETLLNPNPNAPMIDGDQAEKVDYLPQIHNLENDVVIDCKLVHTPRKESNSRMNENENENEERKVLKSEEINEEKRIAEQDNIENITLPLAKSEKNLQKVEDDHENKKIKKIVELKSEPVLNLIPKVSINRENGLSVIY